MTGALQLTRIAVDARGLTAYAAARAVADDDLGYALHLALRGRFGSSGPQPFRFLHEPGQGPTLLAYGRRMERVAASVAAEPALPEAGGDGPCASPSRVLSGRIETRAMPGPDAWPPGREYAFEVLVRPVRRSGSRARDARRGSGRASPGGERDAYLSAVEGLEPGTHGHTRESVYADWLARRLAPAAELTVPPELRRFRLTRVYRSTHGAGKGRRVDGPEALMRGRLRVVDGAAFEGLLERGVGRHVAFGFGMLLVRPVTARAVGDDDKA